MRRHRGTPMTAATGAARVTPSTASLPKSSGSLTGVAIVAEPHWLNGLDLSPSLLTVTDETLDRMTRVGTGWSAWVVRSVARELQVARDRLALIDGQVLEVGDYIEADRYDAEAAQRDGGDR